MKYKCGCLPKIHDERDYQFKDICDCPAGAEYYPKEYINPLVRKVDVLDQGGSMMCTAYAGAMYRYLYEYADSNNREMFSPCYIYGNREDNEYQGEGDYLRNVLKRLVKSGICFNDTLDFRGTYRECKNQYQKNKNKYDKEAYPFRLSSYYVVKTTNEIKKAIMETGAVFASYPVYDNWYYVGEDGYVGFNKGNYNGNHCILIVGWKKVNGIMCWCILNSWDTTYGDNGFCYVPIDVQIAESWCMLDSIKEMEFMLFKDIEKHWAKDNIEDMANKGIINGYEDGTYKPDNTVTRAEIATIAKRIIDYIKG